MARSKGSGAGGKEPQLNIRPGGGRSANSVSGNPQSLMTRARILIGRVGALTRQSTGGRAQNRGRAAAHRSVARAGSSRLNQRVVVKARVVKARANNVAKTKTGILNHISYLRREGVNLEGEQPELFGEGGKVSGADTFEFADRAKGDRHHFRFIVSPEHGAQIDLTQYTRDLMQQMETDLGTKLDWLAVPHYDTDNPHVHIMVRGVDERGADLVIDRDYISRGIRTRAEELATRELGQRTELEVEQQQQRDLTANRVIGIDNHLETEMQTRGKIEVSEWPQATPWAKRTNTMRLTRLAHLESLGMATENQPGVWQLREDFTKELRAMSEQGDIIKTIHKHARGVERMANAIAYDKTNPEHKEITGKVIGRGLKNELYDEPYIVVAATDGNTYYTGLSRYAESEGLKAREGDIVTLKTSERPTLGTTDKNIIEFASKNGGLYDPAAHLEEVKESLKRSNRTLPNGIEPEEFIESHVTRLGGHAGRGLVQPEGDLWRIPADLEAKLEEIGKTAGRDKFFTRLVPESRLSIEQQITARGPTWLDEQAKRDIVPGSAKTDMQREVQAAALSRRAYLRQIDLAETSPEGQIRYRRDTMLRLAEMEREDALERLSRKHGTPAVLQPGQKFAGKFVAMEHLPSGPHAVVKAGEVFTVVPMHPSMSKNVGRDLELTMGKAPSFARETQRNLQLGRVRMVLAKTRDLDKDVSLGL